MLIVQQFCTLLVFIELIKYFPNSNDKVQNSYKEEYITWVAEITQIQFQLDCGCGTVDRFPFNQFIFLIMLSSRKAVAQPLNFKYKPQHLHHKLWPCGDGQANKTTKTRIKSAPFRIVCVACCVLS